MTGFTFITLCRFPFSLLNLPSLLLSKLMTFIQTELYISFHSQKHHGQQWNKQRSKLSPAQKEFDTNLDFTVYRIICHWFLSCTPASSSAQGSRPSKGCSITYPRQQSFTTEHFKQQWKCKNQGTWLPSAFLKKVDEGLSAQIQILWWQLGWHHIFLTLDTSW